MAITYGTRRGGDEYSRVYDRLRKRSQRADQRLNGEMSRALDETTTALEYDVLIEAAFDDFDAFYGESFHSAYVAGVRDALNSIGVAIGGRRG